MRAGRQKLIDLVLLQLPPPAESGRPACICVIVLVPEILHPRSAILKAESLMGERQSVIDDRDNCPPRRTRGKQLLLDRFSLLEQIRRRRSKLDSIDRGQQGRKLFGVTARYLAGNKCGKSLASRNRHTAC
jgi:hypothetical protein